MEPTGTLTTADGTRLCYYDRPVATPSAALCLVHGLGEHAGRYAALAERLNQAGITVRAYDQRGHGRSDGPRGGLARAGDLTADLRLVFDDFAVQQNAATLPPFLFGHSLGGLVAAHFAVMRMSPLRGLVLSSPALALRMSGAQRWLLRTMLRLAPDFAVPNGLEVESISHDPTVVAAYQSDPLVHGKVTARLVDSMQRAIEVTQERAGDIAAPVLLLYAGADRLVDASGARRFAGRLAGGPHRVRCYDDSYHEIFNETAARRALPLDDLLTWLGDQTNNR